MGTMVLLSLLLKIWTFHPRIPIIYDGDGLMMLSAFKNFQHTQWYFNSDLVGYPYGQHLQDFPAIADGFCLTLSWALVKIFRDPVLAFNLFFISTYPITAIGGYIGSRIIGLKRITSGIVGVLYTFMPFHALHGAGHTYLIMYPVIPIVIACTIHQIRTADQTPIKPTVSSVFRTGRGYIVLGCLAAVSGLYYAFFSAIVLSIGVLLILLTSREIQRITRLLLSLFTTCLVVILQAIPILWFQRQNGANLNVAARTSAEIEYYSLRLIDLLLPRPDHALSAFARFSQNNGSSYIPGEPTAYLGLLGAIGVIILIIGLFKTSRGWFEESGLSILSKIFVLLVLMSILGGLNQVLASFGFTQIRVWSRSSILIGFLALIALGLVLESTVARVRLKPIITGICALFLVCLGVADTNRVVPDEKYSELSDVWHNDEAVVREVENIFGEGARVLQIPVLKFPEQGAVYQLPDYAQLRGQLHSDSLCWSYGAVNGRDDNRTIRWRQLPISALVKQARAQGFDALWFELRGYEDSGLQVAEVLNAILGPSVLKDRLKTVEIFDLREDSNQTRQSCH